MARQVVDIGTEGNDGTGDSIRESFRKVNANFQEIYAVVGQGGQITWTLLADTPDSLDPYQGNNEAAYIPIVAQDAGGIEIRRLASNSEETDGVVQDTITYNVTEDGVLILKTANAQIEQDNEPALGGPLNARGRAVGNVSITQAAIENLNSVHSTDLTIDDLVIDKGYADRNYYNRQAPGEEVNIADEPSDTSDFFKDFTVDGDIAEIVDHGLTQGSKGAGWTYTTTGDPLDIEYTLTSGATQVTETDTLTDGQTLYIIPRGPSQVEFYLNFADTEVMDDVIRESLRLKLSGGTGTQTIENPYYDSTLLGNWLSNEALPRNSVVRRQGDSMEGVLNLADHPGSLAGAGTPGGIEDLQAATKLYVDSQSTESTTSLFVSSQGSDSTIGVPTGRKGRSLAYAYRTIGGAARKAEEIQLASPFETGPYMQDVIYTEIAGASTDVTKSQVTTQGVDSATAGDLFVKQLISLNKEFIIQEVFAWIDQNVASSAQTVLGPNNVEVNWAALTYNKDRLSGELGRALNASAFDHLAGTTANILSKRIGLEYFSQLDLQVGAGLSPSVFESVIDRTRNVLSIVLNNDDNAPFTNLQTNIEQKFLANPPDEGGNPVPLPDDKTSIDNNLTLIQNIVNQGVFSAPLDISGNLYDITITNGSNDFVDQGNPQNRDLRVGKLIQGKSSGALGRIISYTAGGLSDDTISLELVRPIDFELDEELEFGNAVKSRNISIKVESGPYYEDFPIRLPENTTIVGDESRRVIVRPRSGTSRSVWADVFFYRDLEFDGLTADDNTSITNIADNNLPSAGTQYIDPNTGELTGYFGRHYLNDPTEAKNVDATGSLAVTNVGEYADSAELIQENVNFIVDETIAWVEERTDRPSPPSGFNFAFTPLIRRQFTRTIREAVVSFTTDLRDGDSLATLDSQGNIFFNFPAAQKDALDEAFGYVRTILEDVLQNQAFVRASAIDGFIASDAAEQTINNGLALSTDVYDSSANTGIILNLIELLLFAFDNGCNPSRSSQDVDAFMLNDASMIRGITVQGIGGFAAVLDPAGQILTKAPYINNCLVYSKSLNRQAFRGGVFADAFCANTPLTVTQVQDSGFRLSVKAAAGSALALRKPVTPAPFYINGVRYQVNDIPLYDPDAAEPIAELVLDSFSGQQDNNGDYIGFQETLVGGEYDITLQTPGNRTIYSNDVILINDLGYGVVASNDAICEIASTFTGYCYAGYFAAKGGQIRSSAGGNSYGVRGLVAEGFNPNEVPDDVVLVKDVTQEAKTFNAEVVLTLDGNISVNAGDTVTQNSASGTGTAILPTNSNQIYLKDVSGTFNTGNDIEVNASGTDTVPTSVDANDYGNPQGLLAIHFYDTEYKPNDRGKVTYYHNDGGSPSGEISSYRVTTVEEILNVVIDGLVADDSIYSYTALSRGPGEVVGTGAVVLVSKTQQDGGTYFAEVYNGAAGQNYLVGDTFTITGDKLNGTTPANDATVTVEEVIKPDALLDTGTISRVSISGDANVVSGLTPQRSGKVYRANFSANDEEFSVDGLTEAVPEEQFVTLLDRRSFLFDELRDTENLTIRPSTAINFAEQEEFTYRAISLSTVDSTGADVGSDSAYTSTNTTFDYVNLVIDNTYKTLAGSAVDELSGTVGSTNLGSSTGDTTIAVTLLSDRLDVYRLNNNQFTDSNFSPPFNDNTGNELEYTNALPMIISWQGKRHYVYNYREVLVDGTNEVQSTFDADGNTFALVDLAEVTGVELTLSAPSTWNRLENTSDVAIVRQKNNITAQGLVRIAGVDRSVLKLYEEQGTFNTTDDLEISYDGGSIYTDLVDGGSSPVSPVSVLVRDTNLTGQSTGIAEPLTTILNDTVTVRAAIQDGSLAIITTQISLCRATAHDFNDIGTGSYNDSNIPNVVLGRPVNSPDKESQVFELDKGRVFYESTDQDGFFQVGRFFNVDQGTGTVTFAASIALSDVDGIGFRRGVVVNEFSTDSSMSDNANDAVPTESATRGYIDRRLGFNQAGNAVTNPLGPNVLTDNGAVPMAGNLNLAGFSVTNLAPITLSSDDRTAVPKDYVDSRTESFNKFKNLRDVEVATADSNQLLGLSGVKTAYLLSTSLSGGTFAIGQVLTNSGGTNNYGTIVGLNTDSDPNFGNILKVSFTPGPDNYSEVDPLAVSLPRIYHKASGTTTANGSGVVTSGPFFEVINIEEDASSDISLSVVRPNNNSIDPSASVNLQIKANTVVNADVNAGAEIAQSKLNLQEADTYTGSEPSGGTGAATVQANLGLSKFNDNEFTVTRGYVKLKDNGVAASKLQQVPTDTVLGRSSGGTGNVSPISFSDIVNQGDGLQLTDFPSTSIENVESANYSNAGVLTRKGANDFTVVPATTTGSKNSFVKTTNSGRIVANDIAIGQDPNFVVLRATSGGSELTVSTPTGGTVLTSQGASTPKVSIPGNLDVGATGVSQSTLQGNSGAAGDSWIGSTWARHSFIEAISGGGAASTGISIGLGSGQTLNGEVGIVTANTGNNTSPIPFLFSSTGVRPDIDEEYDIGTSGNRYKDLWIRNVNSSGNFTTSGNIEAGSASHVEVGRGSGSVAMTINDSQGNANLTFNHRDGVPDDSGSSARITSAVDSGGGTLSFEVADNTTSGVSVSTSQILRLDSGGALITSGTFEVNGSATNINSSAITLGNSSTDELEVNAEITSNVYPRANSGADSGLNLGTSGRRWNTVYATVFDGTATSARYADLAENYLADLSYKAGTVLVFGGDEEVTTTVTKSDHRAAGVVSTEPAHLMNSDLQGDNVVALALQGRVPCNVIGKVRKGDIIVTSGVAGYGCVNNTPTPGTMIGKAVGTKTTDERGIVEVVVGR